MPDLLTGVGRTARAIDAKHEGLDIIVLGYFLEGLNDLFADDTVSFLIGDLAGEVEHRYFIFGLGVRTLHLRQLIGREHMVVLSAGIDAQQGVHILAVHDGIHKTGFAILFRTLQAHVAVGESIELRLRQVTGCSHSGFVLIPDTVQVLHGLQAIGIGHGGTEIGFYGGLEGTYLNDLHLYADLLHEAGEVHLLRGKTVPIHLSRRVEADTVGYRNEVVVGLTVVLRGSDHPFAAGLEVDQRIAYRLGARRRHR